MIALVFFGLSSFSFWPSDPRLARLSIYFCSVRHFSSIVIHRKQGHKAIGPSVEAPLQTCYVPLACFRPHYFSTMTEEKEVKLAVYDLSRGLARSLSAQFLGPAHAIDIVPHTALLAFGREYYFGGGIQNCTHGEFTAYSGLMPIEIQSLGHTTLTQQQFEAWCTTVGASEFAPESYDLLQHNCNTFSNVAATQGLGLSRGVPQWILDVPGRFLASPMGQMIRPILDNMQLQGPGRVGGGYQRPGMPMSTPAPAPAPVPPPAAAAAAAMDNPWANIPAKMTTDEIKTPILNSHCKPLLSADINTIKICVTKLVAAAEREESGNAQKILDELASLLLDPKYPLPHEALEYSAPFLLLNLAPESSKSVLNAVYSLMLLRLIVLHPAADDGARIVLSEIIGIIGGRLIKSTKENDEMFGNHAIRSMAWCTLSNATGTDFGASFLRQDLALRSGLVDAALLDISSSQQPRVEVRQSALAFLYNVAHDLSVSPKGDDTKDELSDTVVTLLCGMIEGIDEESNSTARLRRLLIVGKTLKPNHGQNIDVAAKSLVNDLGFVEVIASLRSSNSAGEDNDAKTAKGVATEICLLLS